MIRYFIVTIAAIVAAASIWLGVLYIKISRLNNEIAEKELTIAAYAKTIAEAEAAIDIQNARLDAFKIGEEQVASRYKEEQARITARYGHLLKKAKEQAGDESSCEATLKIIEEAQRGFLYK